MKTSRLPWTLTALVLVLLTLGTGLPAHAVHADGPTFPIPATPILPQPGRPVPSYIGQPAVAQPVAAPAIPANPFMGSLHNIQSWSAMHNDTYMSDTYFQAGATGGPLGKSPVVKSTSLGYSAASPTGLALGMNFDSAGRLIATVVTSDATTGKAWVRVRLIDPATLATLAWLDLPSETLGGGAWRPAGVYSYQDQLGRVVTGTPDRTVWVVDHSCSGPTTCSFMPVFNSPCDPTDPTLQCTYDLRPAIPADDQIEALQPDWAGRLWFTSKGGIVGTLDLSSGKLLGWVTLAGERIVNGSAGDETGGVYVVTTKYMYRFDADAKGAPSVTWRESYDAGTHMKAGQVDTGSGTTPTLMGRDYVTISDNAEPQMHVVVWRRAKDVQGSRLVCEVPVFLPGQGSNENSLVATDKSIVVENNFGYKGPQSLTHGQTTKPGLARIDINADGKGCHTVWTNMAESIPTVVTKMSLANGLIYTYTKPKGPPDTNPWYFTAIDFATGQTVYKVLAGTGPQFDNDYAPIYLGPDGTFYVGVLGGIVAMHDGQ